MGGLDSRKEWARVRKKQRPGGNGKKQFGAVVTLTSINLHYRQQSLQLGQQGNVYVSGTSG